MGVYLFKMPRRIRDVLVMSLLGCSLGFGRIPWPLGFFVRVIWKISPDLSGKRERSLVDKELRNSGKS